MTTTDLPLIAKHDCERIERGACEDYPCCGHEAGDCSGLRYGSDEAIKAEYLRRMADDPEGYYESDY